MTFGRVVFVICVLLLLWHFRDSLPIDRGTGLGVVTAPGKATSPKAVRGAFMMPDDGSKIRLSLRFIDDTHFQFSKDGKIWGPVLTYNLFDDKIFLNFPDHVAWTMEVRGQSLYRSDLRQTFLFTGK